MDEYGDVARDEPPKGLNSGILYTPQEVSDLRSNVLMLGKKGYKYTADVGSVSTMFISPDLGKIPEQELAEITCFLGARENGERYRYEPLIINALFKQFEIAKKFGLSEDSIFKNFKLIVDDKGTTLVNDISEIYLRVLDEHVQQLRQQGATEEEIVTEFAGHIFHESVHDGAGNMSEVLFEGRGPLGEITPVTAQLAYYLDENYRGPAPYDIYRYNDGFNKIKSGESSGRDYDIATYVGVILLLQSLEETYPTHLTVTNDLDPITKCQTIIDKLPPEDRQTLIPCLKKAIAHSTDEKVYESILDQARQEKSDKDAQSDVP